MYLSYAHNNVFPVGRRNSTEFAEFSKLSKSDKIIEVRIRVSVKMLPVICVLLVEWLSATDDTTQHAFDCSFVSLNSATTIIWHLKITLPAFHSSFDRNC